MKRQNIGLQFVVTDADATFREPTSRVFGLHEHELRRMVNIVKLLDPLPEGFAREVRVIRHGKTATSAIGLQFWLVDSDGDLLEPVSRVFLPTIGEILAMVETVDLAELPDGFTLKIRPVRLPRRAQLRQRFPHIWRRIAS